jgi:predicted phosphodiesterase
MKLGLISDIHSNLEALTAVLEDLKKQKVDKLFSLGDVIGYGCDPIECLRLVNENCEVKLMGNHEFAALGLMPSSHLNDIAQESLEWTRQNISDREMAIISDFELDTSFEGNYFVHASPFEPENWHYVLTTKEALAAFEEFGEKICFFGHTHIPVIFSFSPEGRLRQTAGHDFLPNGENRYLINVGSVGQPRDNDPRACYAIFDTEEGALSYYRVGYDISETQAKMTRANIPSMLIDRLSTGR